ncbi:MAG: hypothetical protein Q4F28_14920 [Eubacteriales bacterium]|nr:hypothetical protein [Eubacteriales bacterium]
MKKENQKNRGQVRGYLFEQIVCLLLEQNHCAMVQPDRFNKSRVRRVRENFIELKGRGGWHAIDCPFDYNRTLPFLYPVRLIGEVRYHQTTVTKDAIRNFIGVLRDIQENYFIDDSLTPEMVRERRMEIGVFFSVNGFQAEAERLAYSHGIRTISYKNNPIIQVIRDDIDALESEYISYDLFAQKNTRFFLRDFDAMMSGALAVQELVERYELAVESRELFEHLYGAVCAIRSSIMATTNTGMVFHFLGNEEFPEELFAGTDVAVGHIYYQNLKEENQIAYYLELEKDQRHRRFYFTPPEGLSEQAVYGLGAPGDESQRDTGREIHMTLTLGGIQRNLTVMLDTDRISSENGNLLAGL